MRATCREGDAGVGLVSGGLGEHGYLERGSRSWAVVRYRSLAC